MATVLTRWIASAVLALGLGAAAMAPTPARAGDDDWVRVVVDVADVIYHSGYPYYRGDYGYRDRLIVVRDHYGRPAYYRNVYRPAYRHGPPYGNAYGYYRNGPGRGYDCNKHGKCKVTYYDARYDHRRDRAYYYDRHHDNDRYYGRRWRDHDDD